MTISDNQLYSLYLRHREISTDSREIIPGSLFFSLKGDNFDGNAFSGKAIESGAAFAVIDNPSFDTGERTLLVENVLRSLQAIAVIHRQSLNIPVIGITGTNGKTTTKELINAVLSSQLKTHATSGNLNNHIGVPFTILSIPEYSEIAVIEMGANHPGEIEFLCSIAKPTHGIITNIGKAHLEGFGSFDGIVRAKSELYHYIAETRGELFVNSDNPLLMSLSESISRITYGREKKNYISGTLTSSDPYLDMKFYNHELSYPVRTNLVGDYNYENVLAAVAIGTRFNITGKNICSAIENYKPANSRSQAIKTAHNLVIVDTYNANPTSMRAALLNFNRIDSKRKMVILGGMKELGQASEAEHLEIVKLVKELKFNNAVFSGPEFMQVSEDEGFTCLPDSTATFEWLKTNPVHDYTILVKGSRGSKMEVVLEAL
jgi:UDP-N-acetylmuramoyl-tripeptide--D-alanyl-D-alanine ligase